MADTGHNKILGKMQAFAKRMPAAVGGAFYREAQRVMRAAIPKTPVEHSRLRGTAYVSPPMGDEQTVELGFGTAYAVPVHENTDPDVNWTAPGTGPKFLEKAIDETDSGRLDRIAKDAWKLLERGRGFGSGGNEIPTRPRDEGGAAGGGES